MTIAAIIYVTTGLPAAVLVAWTIMRWDGRRTAADEALAADPAEQARIAYWANRRRS